MRAFSDKGIGETLTYTCVFADMLPANVTIVSGTVTASVADFSVVTDDNPSAIINGAAIVNVTSFVLKNRTVLPNQAILQSITGGVIGCTYVLTFAATLTDDEVINEDVTLTISQYVPSEV